jgi:hypothetical protein
MLVPRTRGLTEFQAYISAMARNCRGDVTEEMTDYFLGNDARGLRHYPAQRGQQYTRTMYLRNSWKRRGQGVMSRAENTANYSPYLYQDGRMAWWTAKYGWRSSAVIIESNMRGAIRAAERRMVRKRK